MQKKWVIGITAVSLAAVTAIGSTLAYFTTRTQQMTNNFTVKAPNGISGQLREKGWDGYDFNEFVDQAKTQNPDGKTAKSDDAGLGYNQAKVMMPNATITKDPTLMNTTNYDFATKTASTNVPVYMAIKVIKSNFNNASFTVNSGWEKLDLTGYKFADPAQAGDIYVWYGSDTATAPAEVESGKPTGALFNTVKISKDAVQQSQVSGTITQDQVLKNFSLQLQGSAVQADNLTDVDTINTQLAAELGAIK